QGNITLPGEQEMADRLTAYWSRYSGLVQQFFALAPERKEERTRLYFTQLLPNFKDIKREADAVLDLNQKNMEDENAGARAAATGSIGLLVVARLVAGAVASLIVAMLSRSILEPIGAVTRAARAMSGGNYDQVVPATTHDELGELALAFNTMARRIREF